MLEVLRGLIYRPVGEILRDVVDIAIVAYIMYRTLLVLKGTRAMQMGIGFLIFGVLYLGANYFQLETLLNVLSYVASSIILIAVVVFQNDIRRALVRMGAKAWFSRGQDRQLRVIDDVVAAATELARHRIGALIVFEKDASVLEFAKSQGLAIDALVSQDLLVSLFLPESLNKTHDGALLIHEHRIARAGVFLPMPSEETKISDTRFGSRHRAAIGIVEETDAVVVVVSEERGEVTLFFPDKGGIHVTVPNLRGPALRDALLGCFGRQTEKKKQPVSQQKRGREAPEAAKKTARKPEVKAPKKSDGPAVHVARTGDTPPPRATLQSRGGATPMPPMSSTRVAASASGVKATSSGRYFAPAEEDGETEAAAGAGDSTQKPAAATVSKPMSAGSPPPADDEQEQPAAEPAKRALVTKAMTPTNLPATTVRLSGDDT